MSCVVVDTSLAVKWVLMEPHAREARQLRNDWASAQITPIVPSWFACEVANVLYRRARAKTVALADARRGLQDILSLVDVLDFDPAIALRALELAQRFSLRASYDAHYLALAEYLSCELWTADEDYLRDVVGSFPWVRWVGEVTPNP